MFIRLTSIPELQHLDPRSRQTLLRATVGRWVMLRIFANALIVACVCTLFTQIWLESMALFRLEWWSLVINLLIWTPLVYWVYLVRIRGRLILFLEERRKHERLPLCLHCGYNTTGLMTSSCPECGKNLGAGVAQ